MGMPRILAIRNPVVRMGIGQSFSGGGGPQLRIHPQTSQSTLARIPPTAKRCAVCARTGKTTPSTYLQKRLDVTPLRVPSDTACFRVHGLSPFQTNKSFVCNALRLARELPSGS